MYLESLTRVEQLIHLSTLKSLDSNCASSWIYALIYKKAFFRGSATRGTFRCRNTLRAGSPHYIKNVILNKTSRSRWVSGEKASQIRDHPSLKTDWVAFCLELHLTQQSHSRPKSLPLRPLQKGSFSKSSFASRSKVLPCRTLSWDR
jgi:hypothetical protein